MKGVKPCQYPRYRWLDMPGSKLLICLVLLLEICQRYVSDFTCAKRLYELLFHEQCMLLLMAEVGASGNLDRFHDADCNRIVLQFQSHTASKARKRSATVSVSGQVCNTDSANLFASSHHLESKG